MKTIKELKKISGQRVLLRADFNVPIKNGKVVSDFRIKKTIPTISIANTLAFLINTYLTFALYL